MTLLDREEWYEHAVEETLFEMLSHQPNLALAVSDPEGGITMTTPALRWMLGREFVSLSEQALRPLQLQDAGSGRSLTRRDMPLVRACAGETVRDEVLSLRRPDGHSVYLRCSAVPLRDGGADITGAIVMVQDVTVEWLASQKQAELRDRLVATVNHELRTPLTKILGHCELLADVVTPADHGLPAAVATSIAAIERAARELGALAQRVTVLADLEAATHVDAASLDLVPLIARELDVHVSKRATDRDCHVVLEAPHELNACVDARLVTWAVRELVDNAVRHAPPRSEVRVALTLVGEMVVISVADRGPGVPTVDRERLLRPFEAR